MVQRVVLSEVGLFTSASVLESRCEGWFAERFGTLPWFPTRRGKPVAPRPGTRLADAVLFGGFVRELRDTRHWSPHCDYRLWTLCGGARDVLVRIMDVPAECVAVIPRYELFPIKRKERALPRAKQAWTLVYGGRLVEFKYVELILRVGSVLQTAHREPVELVFQGNFVSEQARARFWYLVHTLPWTSPPRVLRPKAPARWTETKLVEPVFITLSKFEKEDFGVAVAEAQSAGWPVILSDWGGHREVRGRSVIRIPPEMIAGYEEPEARQRHSAKKIARRIATSLRGRPRDRLGYGNPPVVSLPEPIRLEKLRALDLRVHEALYGNRAKNSPGVKSLRKRYLRTFGG